MEKQKYEEYLDDDYFYKKDYLVENQVKIEKNTLYLKDDQFLSLYFENSKPNIEFFYEFIRNKGLYFFLLNMLEDESISHIKFQGSKVLCVSKYIFFKMYSLLLETISDKTLIPKIHSILEYNNLPDEELLDYIEDESCFNELYYKKNIDERNEIIDNILDYIIDNNICSRFYISSSILNRIKLLESVRNIEIKDNEIKKEHYYINESLIDFINQYRKNTYSDVELAIHIFTRLNMILKVTEIDKKIDLKNIYEITIKNNIVNKEIFLVILKSLLDINEINYQIDNNIITVGNAHFIIDEFPIIDIQDEEKVKFVLNSISREEKKKNAYASLKEKLDIVDINIDEKNKLKTFIELITRGEKISDLEYQNMIFNIFYKDNDNYELMFLKVKNKIGNYEYVSILRVGIKYIIIDEDISVVSKKFIDELYKENEDGNNKVYK